MAMHFQPNFTTVDRANEDVLHVVYATNAAGFAGLLNSMRSLALHLETPGHCTIHVIIPQDDMEKTRELVQCFHESLSSVSAVPAVELHALKPLPFNMSVAPTGVAEAHWFHAAAFTRLFIPDYIPHASRALWLDTDTIVQTDVSILRSFSMKYSLAAALENPIIAEFEIGYWPQSEANYSRSIGKNASNLFNSGVLLIDVQKWLAEDRERTLTKWFATLKGFQGDQLMLNFELGNDFDILDSNWNLACMSAWKDPEMIKSAYVLHWSGSSKKPWHDDKDPKLAINDKYWEKYTPTERCGDW